MIANDHNGVIFVEGEPLPDNYEAYQDLMTDLFTSLSAVPSEDQFNQDLRNEQEARRFRRRHLLLAALRSIANHNVAADARTLALQDILFELSKAVRDFAHDIDSLDRGFSATLIASPAPYEAGETTSADETDRNVFVPERDGFISAERKLILAALALSSVNIAGLTKEEVRKRTARVSGLKAGSLKAQGSHFNDAVKFFRKTKRGVDTTGLKTPRYSEAEIAFYDDYFAEFSGFQRRFDSGTIVPDDEDPDAPRSVFDLAKVVLFGWGHKRLTPSTVKPRKR
jgi:hypothetical protein